LTASPSWLRTTLCEDLAEVQRRQGMVPDTVLIEKAVDEDIRRWSAENRERKFQYTPKIEKKADDERHEAAKRVAQDKDLSFSSKPVTDDVLTAHCPCGGVCKNCKLRARLLQLMEPLPVAERTPKVEVWKNAKRPAWCREVLNVWTWMTFSKRAKVLKKKGELERVVLRKLEDIANRSNSILGLGEWNR